MGFGDPRNKEKTFQGQRFDDELGLDWIQFKWRNHDPQIGRFVETDPLSTKYLYNSPYAFSENHVTTHIELEGLEKFPIYVSNNKEENFWRSKHLRTTREEPASSNVSENKHTEENISAVKNKTKGGFHVSLSMNLEVGAGAAIKIPAVGELSGGKTAIFMGIKDNEPYFNATNQRTGEVTLFEKGGGSILGNGMNWERKLVKGADGKYEVVSETVTTQTLLIFTKQIENNYQEHKQITTTGVSIGASIGIGMIVNAEITIGVRKVTDLK